jgi:hypothetical protein
MEGDFLLACAFMWIYTSRSGDQVMEQITRGIRYPQPKLRIPSLRLRPYLRLVLALIGGFTGVILSIRLLSQTAAPPDPFATFSNLFPGQQADTRLLEAQGYSCWLETLPTIADISQHCSQDLQTGPFSNITVTIWDGSVRVLDLVVRENALTIGDLVRLWGRPHIHQHGFRGQLKWLGSGNMDLTASYRGRYSLFLPAGIIVFMGTGDSKP